jgi:UDP-galactopyranose mutase
MNKFDYIIVGSGFAGSIIAERLASQQNKKILLIEKRDHIAGNMYDYQDNAGILVHKYGPHLFRTNSIEVQNYLSQFTNWHEYQHKVLANVDEKLVPVPFNLNSLEILLPIKMAQLYKSKIIEIFGMGTKVPISVLRMHDDKDIKELGNFIFEKIYLNYTVKQWGDKPENLDFNTITTRVPVHISYDDRYFQQSFQALPEAGYTKMFEKMLRHPNIEIRLNTNSRDLIKLDLDSSIIYFESKPFKGGLVYTGQIDELFDYQLGELPYRSLKFVTKTYDQDFFQPTGTVNYPNTEDYTRITEYNHMMKMPNSLKTTVMYEYPQKFDKNDPTKDIPYYPIPKAENSDLYDKYSKLAKNFRNLTLIGRLAEYRYYDMEDIIIRALREFDNLSIIPKI